MLKDESSFTHQVQDGKKAVSKKGVILAGLLRDDGDSTRKLLDSLHSVGSAFARHHMIIIENQVEAKDEKNPRKTRPTHRLKVLFITRKTTKCLKDSCTSIFEPPSNLQFHHNLRFKTFFNCESLQNLIENFADLLKWH